MVGGRCELGIGGLQGADAGHTEMMTSRRVPLPVSSPSSAIPLPLPLSPSVSPPSPHPEGRVTDSRETARSAGLLHVKCSPSQKRRWLPRWKTKQGPPPHACRVRPFPTLLLACKRPRPHSADAAGSRVLCSLGMVPHHQERLNPGQRRVAGGPHCGPHLLSGVGEDGQHDVADAICVRSGEPGLTRQHAARVGFRGG